MEIRHAQPKDIPALLALLLQVGQVHHAIRPDLFRAGAQKYNKSELEQILSNANTPVYVAVEAEQVCGYAFCQVERIQGHSAMTDQQSLYLDDLCVHQDYRGQHVGTILYDYVCQQAKVLGCQSITLKVWTGNEQAQRFYESRGLKPRYTCLEARV